MGLDRSCAAFNRPGEPMPRLQPDWREHLQEIDTLKT
jgi:hypothetical protein